MTGTSSNYINNRFQESLSGRKKIFDIYPLHFGEYLDFKGVTYKPTSDIYNLQHVASEYNRLKSYYEDFMERGGFPEVAIAKSNDEKRDLLYDILSSYINMDILQLSEIRKTLELDQLISLLAARIGTKLDISKLSSATRLSRATVENYIEFLENTYLIKTVPVYALNPDREIVKSKKVYFHDTGIASICAQLSGGAKFENTVFNQLHHFGEICYYQLKTGKEIDFILDKKRCFEVKETGHITDYNKMINLAGNIGITEGKVLVRNISNSTEHQVWGGMIR